MSYQPQPGTIPARVIVYLRERPGQWIAAAEIAEALNCDSGLRNFMSTAQRAGAVAIEKRMGRVFMALGDGIPLPDFPDNEPERAEFFWRGDGGLRIKRGKWTIVLSAAEVRELARSLGRVEAKA